MSIKIGTITEWFRKLNLEVFLYTYDDKYLNNEKKRCKTCQKELEISDFRSKRNDCIHCESQYRKIRWRNNKKRLTEINRKYRISNIEKERERQKVYGSNNRQNISRKEKKRYKENEQFRLKKNLRSRLYSQFYISNKSKERRSLEYGINYEKIIQHLGPKPSENHTIDHIVPLSLFDFSNIIHIQAAFLPENHQWLLDSENFSKGNKLLNNELTNKTLKIINEFILSQGCKEIIIK